VGPQGHVVAIEPNPETVQKLRDNIQASGDNNVAVQPVACSDSETYLDLFAAARSNTGESSLSQTNASQAGTVRNVYHVQARPLDDILETAGVTRVDLVKIDVEGAEMLVFKGARQTLAHYSPVISVELIDRQLKSMGSSVAEVTEFLRSQGYTARQTIGDNVVFAK
jgi:FkbM family methyltransferase